MDIGTLVHTIQDQLVTVKESVEDTIANDKKYAGKEGYKRLQDEDWFNPNHLEFVGAEFSEVTSAGFDETKTLEFTLTSSDGHQFVVIAYKK